MATWAFLLPVVSISKQKRPALRNDMINHSSWLFSHPLSQNNWRWQKSYWCVFVTPVQVFTILQYCAERSIESHLSAGQQPHTVQSRIRKPKTGRSTRHNTHFCCNKHLEACIYGSSPQKKSMQAAVNVYSAHIPVEQIVVINLKWWLLAMTV